MGIKRCINVKKKIVKVTCPRPIVRSTINVDPTPVNVNPTPVNVNPTPVNVNPTPVNVNPTLTLSPSTRLCNQFPSSTFTFFNADTIIIPASGTATPYPSTISVSGLTGPISKVTVTLFQISHTHPDDLDILLVAPDGSTNTILMSDAGLGGINDVRLTFDDNAGDFLPKTTPLVSGTFKPSNFDVPPENLPLPAPPSSPSVALSNFNKLSNPNGTWSLFVNDDSNLDSGNILHGWALGISTPATEECTFTPL